MSLPLAVNWKKHEWYTISQWTSTRINKLLNNNEWKEVNERSAPADNCKTSTFAKTTYKLIVLVTCCYKPSQENHQVVLANDNFKLIWWTNSNNNNILMMLRMSERITTTKHKTNTMTKEQTKCIKIWYTKWNEAKTKLYYYQPFWTWKK
jgi:hypothetical protein